MRHGQECRKYTATVGSSVAFDQFVADVDELIPSLENVLRLDHRRLSTTSGSGDEDSEADARRRGNFTLGQLEVLRAIRATAVEARDVQRLPFDRLIGALESSYLTLEQALIRQQHAQQGAFSAALAGGSRSVYDHETDLLNLASGRLEQVTRWLHHARTLETESA